MMSRATRDFRCGRRDISFALFTPHRYWPGWCLGLALDYQRSGGERSIILTLGIIQVQVDVIERVDR